jgi:hypothetical protein
MTFYFRVFHLFSYYVFFGFFVVFFYFSISVVFLRRLLKLAMLRRKAGRKDEESVASACANRNESAGE